MNDRRSEKFWDIIQSTPGKRSTSDGIIGRFKRVIDGQVFPLTMRRRRGASQCSQIHAFFGAGHVCVTAVLVCSVEWQTRPRTLCALARPQNMIRSGFIRPFFVCNDERNDKGGTRSKKFTILRTHVFSNLALRVQLAKVIFSGRTRATGVVLWSKQHR